jgi:hypothetical protein
MAFPTAGTCSRSVDCTIVLMSAVCCSFGRAVAVTHDILKPSSHGLRTLSIAVERRDTLYPFGEVEKTWCGPGPVGG